MCFANIPVNISGCNTFIYFKDNKEVKSFSPVFIVMMNSLIDTHAHIYLPEFDDDRPLLLEKAKAMGIEKILMPAIDSETHAAMLQVEQSYESCMAMMGLHPCSVKDNYEAELQIAATYLQRRKFIAVGEIGLDFYWDKTYTQQQYDAFHRQIQWALQYGIPIVIHSRNATEECIDVVKQYPGLKGIFHCFSGTLDQAKQIIEAGFLLGIGGVVTFKNAGLDKIIADIGVKHIVLETDAPYLAPVPYRGKRNESSYITLVAEKVAAVLQSDVDTICKITTQNAYNLFQLSQQ